MTMTNAHDQPIEPVVIVGLTKGDQRCLGETIEATLRALSPEDSNLDQGLRARFAAVAAQLAG